MTKDARDVRGINVSSSASVFSLRPASEEEYNAALEEQAEAEHRKKEQAEAEHRKKEQAAAEQAEREKAEREKVQREKEQREKVQHDKAERKRKAEAEANAAAEMDKAFQASIDAYGAACEEPMDEEEEGEKGEDNDDKEGGSGSDEGPPSPASPTADAAGGSQESGGGGGQTEVKDLGLMLYNYVENNSLDFLTDRASFMDGLKENSQLPKIVVAALAEVLVVSYGFWLLPLVVKKVCM